MCSSVRDKVLPVVPMFHVNACWGISWQPRPRSRLQGAFPGPALSDGSAGLRAHIITEAEGVTFAAGVPTVADATCRRPAKFSTLRAASVIASTHLPAGHDHGLPGFRHGVWRCIAWVATEMSLRRGIAAYNKHLAHGRRRADATSRRSRRANLRRDEDRAQTAANSPGTQGLWRPAWCAALDPGCQYKGARARWSRTSTAWAGSPTGDVATIDADGC